MCTTAVIHVYPFSIRWVTMVAFWFECMQKADGTVENTQSEHNTHSLTCPRNTNDGEMDKDEKWTNAIQSIQDVFFELALHFDLNSIRCRIDLSMKKMPKIAITEQKPNIVDLHESKESVFIKESPFTFNGMFYVTLACTRFHISSVRSTRPHVFHTNTFILMNGFFERLQWYTINETRSFVSFFNLITHKHVIVCYVAIIFIVILLWLRTISHAMCMCSFISNPFIKSKQNTCVSKKSCVTWCYP